MNSIVSPTSEDWIVYVDEVAPVIGAQAAAHWLASLLYGISPGDLPSYLVALVVLPAAALFGCRRPAQRAASANPADIIREE